MKDGAEGVVVPEPRALPKQVDESVTAVCIQDRYKGGQAGSSLLRQVKMARGQAVPCVYVLTSDLAGPDRHILQKQYLVREFLSAQDNPYELASSLLALLADGGPDLILHPDEEKNEFDIDIESVSENVDGDDAGGFDEGSDARTVEMSMAQLRPDLLKADLPDEFDVENMAPRRVHDEVTVGNPIMQAAQTKLGALDLSADDDDGDADDALDLGGHTVEGQVVKDNQGDDVLELTLPVPGASRDLQIPVDFSDEGGEVLDFDEGTDSHAMPRTEAAPPESGDHGLTDADLLDSDEEDAVAALDQQASPPNPTRLDTDSAQIGSVPNEPPSGGASAEEEDMAQIQELKRALLQKKRALDAANKTIDDLQTKLTKAQQAQDEGIPEDEMPKEGVFEDFRYPILLARARKLAWTGSIKMQLPGDTTRTIYLKNGLAVGYATSEPGEKVGKMLVRQGRLTDEDYVKAATRMVERGIKLHEALVELGLIDAETLEVEIRNLTRDQIIAGFELLQGRFTVDEGEEPGENVACFDYGPGEIYVAGYRQYAPKNEMNSLFESMRPQYLIANDRLPNFRPKLGLTGDDERLLRLLGEAYTVEEAVDRAAVEPDEAARVIAALQALDLVEEWSPGVKEFRARLTSERQHYQQEISRIREEASAREKELFEGFERALAKITSALGAGGGANVSMSSVAPKKPSSTAPASAPPSTGSSSTSSIGAPKAGAPVPTLAGPDRSGAQVSVPGASLAAASDAADPAKTEQLDPASLKSKSGAHNLPPPTPTPAPAAKNGALLGDPAKLGSPANEAESKFHEAVRQAAEDRLDEAEVTLREAVRMDASRPDFLTSLARVLLANPRYEREGTLPVVHSLLERAVQLSPDNSEANQLHKEIVAEMGA